MAGMHGRGETEPEPSSAVAVVKAALGAWQLPPLSIQPMESGENGEVFLLASGTRCWVAKLAYATRRHFEPGLAAAWRLSKVMPVDVATPVRTVRGDFVEMVQWPAGHQRPLAVLDFVDGEPLSHKSADAPETVGYVTGLLANRLRDVDPVDVGLDPSSPFVPGERDDDWELGEYAWLNDLSDDIAERVHRLLPQLPHSVAVWDGPEILVDGDGIGLVDFGTTDWMPRVHPIARGHCSRPTTTLTAKAAFSLLSSSNFHSQSPNAARLACSGS